MSRPDVTSNTEHQAGQADRLHAAPDWQDEHDEPGVVGEFGHQHGPGLICLRCAWLKARRQHLQLVHGGQDTDWCTRCDEEHDIADGCQHGLVLCAHCRHNCPDCQADIAYQQAENNTGRWTS